MQYVYADLITSRSMLNAGSLVNLDMSQFDELIGTPRTNLRLAIFDGANWFEIPFKITEQTTLIPVRISGNTSDSPTYSFSEGRITNRDQLTFRMPKPVGEAVEVDNWWPHARSLMLNHRVYVKIWDSVQIQNTIIYIYYKKDGFAPPPYFPNLATIGAEEPIVNGSVTQSFVGPETRVGPFSVAFVSRPETFKTANILSDPTVYHISTVCDSHKFQNTGDSILNFYVEMPSSRSYAWIYITGQSYGDIYVRLFELYINDVLVGRRYPYNSFIYSWDILSYLQTGTNKIGIKLTTYTYSPGYNQYWLVSSWINVKYSASQHITNTQSWFAPYYKFRNTAYNIQNFSSVLPIGITSGVIQVSGTSFGDQYLRRLDVFVDGQAITPSGGVVVGSPFTWTSPDITSLLAFKKYVKVGIRLTTYEYQSGVHWRVTGILKANARFEVWSDNDYRWQWNVHVISGGGASLYDTKMSDHENQFLGPMSFEIKSKEHVSYPRFYVGVMTHVPESCEDAYDLPWWLGYNLGLYITHEIHVSIRDSTGNLIPDAYYSSIEGFASPTTDGQDYYDIGSDMLKILSLIANGLGHPEFGVPAGIASVLIKYKPASFEYGRETNGVYLKDLRRIGDDLSDLLAFTVDYPGSGYYTISLTYKVIIYNWVYFYWGGTDAWFTLTEHTFTYTTQYYYGP